ncbi:hypothetical protein WA158_005510 [Blastocystis sp. Blastoise]
MYVDQPDDISTVQNPSLLLATLRYIFCRLSKPLIDYEFIENRIHNKQSTYTKNQKNELSSADVCSIALQVEEKPRQILHSISSLFSYILTHSYLSLSSLVEYLGSSICRPARGTYMSIKHKQGLPSIPVPNHVTLYSPTSTLSDSPQIPHSLSTYVINKYINTSKIVSSHFATIIGMAHDHMSQSFSPKTDTNNNNHNHNHNHNHNNNNKVTLTDISHSQQSYDTHISNNNHGNTTSMTNSTLRNISSPYYHDNPRGNSCLPTQCFLDPALTQTATFILRSSKFPELPPKLSRISNNARALNPQTPVSRDMQNYVSKSDPSTCSSPDTSKTPAYFGIPEKEIHLILDISNKFIHGNVWDYKREEIDTFPATILRKIKREMKMQLIMFENACKTELKREVYIDI